MITVEFIDKAMGRNFLSAPCRWLLRWARLKSFVARSLGDYL